MDAWDHKDIWRRLGRNFLVEVSRHTVEADPFNLGTYEGPNRWAVYAYIYPLHPHFSKFNGDKMSQPAALVLPLHAGPSMLNVWHGNDSAVTAYQVGADYNHLGDDSFTQMETAEEATYIFREADELVRWLEDCQPGAVHVGDDDGAHA